MPYYPKSQIKTNLYSNGEFALLDSQAIYNGYYWKTSTGKFFTGKTPQDNPIQEIIPIGESTIQTDIIESSPSLEVLDYSFASSTPIPTSNIPPYFATLPTQQDYQIGEFRRYFCKKSNEILYIEISQTSYDLLIAKDPNILWQLYLPFYIPWRLTGTQAEVYRTNRNITILTSQKLQLPQFGRYLKDDYLKYYK
jgi:hypothetical protein